MYNIIVNMYANIKSCISYNNNVSDFFNCANGVRQGENLSPFLFSLFLNDLDSYLLSNNIIGLKTISDEIENDLAIFLKLFVMLYADDTVLLAEDAKDLQNQLNAFSEYCSTWKLKVNVDKTKVMIFGNGRIPRNVTFMYNNNNIEIVKELNYLGIIFAKSGNFNKTKTYLAEKAQRAMYEVLKIGRSYKLSIKIQLDLFDKMVKPILLYGSEVWGFSNNDIIERVHLKFCKLLLNLKSSTPNYMVYGELGRHPLEIDIKIKIISFWSKLAKQTKYSSIVYILLRCMYIENNACFNWMSKVKTIFDECGFTYIWETENFMSHSYLISIVKQRLLDQYYQFWNSQVYNSSKSLS